MKNNLNLTGTGKVYRFSVRQMFKSKANIISLVLLFLFSLFSLPVQSLISGSEARVSLPETLYYKNSSGIELDAQAVIDSLEAKKAPRLVPSDLEDEALLQSLSPQDAAIVISLENGAADVRAFFPAKPGYDRSALDTVVQAFITQANLNILGEAGMTEDVITMMNNFPVSVATESEYLNPTPNEDERFGAFGVQYIYAIILLMLCTLSSSYIIRAIVEEKSSRLIELLMVSVSPLALLVGKILAVMTYILVLFALMFGGMFISWNLTSRFLDVSTAAGMLQSVFGTQSIGQLAAKSIVVILVSLVLGFMINSLIAGISGACCTSMDDVESSNMSVVLIAITGYIISCVVAPLANPAVDIVTTLLPFTAVYVAPVLFLIGRISLPILAASWVLQIICVIFLARLAAAVYHELLLARGERVRLKRLLAIAAGSRKERAA